MFKFYSNVLYLKIISRNMHSNIDTAMEIVFVDVNIGFDSM